MTQARAWSSQASTHLNCHPDARTFLCSLFAPVCLPNPNNPDALMDLQPCHSLCVSVKNACKPKIGRLVPKIVWDTYFDCSKYTIDEGLCVPGKNIRKVTNISKKNNNKQNNRGGNNNSGRQNQCSICSYEPEMDEIESHYCAPVTNFVVKVRKAQLQLVTRKYSGRSQSFIQIEGQNSFFRNTLGSNPRKFYLKKSKKCKCDIFQGSERNEYREK